MTRIRRGHTLTDLAFGLLVIVVAFGCAGVICFVGFAVQHAGQ